MPEKPTIIVQLIHIEGPLKGKIEESADSVLQIGRHPDCQVHFPKDATIVSRNHAEIVRDGNQFKVVDHSTNGTFLNGKSVKEAILKNGDVLMIGDGGPKVSFLAEIKSNLAETFQPTKSPSAFQSPPNSMLTPKEALGPSQPSEQQASSLPKRLSQPKSPQEQIPIKTPSPKPNIDSADVRVQAPLTIQFGATIQSFKMLPVIVGKKSDCDFIIDHPYIIDRHIQIFFFESNYWIKDLTGQGVITINDTPVQGQTPLQPGSRVSLSPQGPTFQFLSGGRLAEVADSPVQAASENVKGSPESSWNAVSNPSRKSKGPLFLLIGFLTILVIVSIWFLFFNETMDHTMTSGLKEWWYRWVEVIRRLVGQK